MQLFWVLGSLFRLDPRVVVRCSGSGVGLRHAAKSVVSLVCSSML